VQGSINVVWQLNDVREADGGFVVCPGSHRATFPVPESVAWCYDQTTVRHVAADAGDVVLFLGSAVTHGALPWKSETPRRVAIISYFSKYSSLFGAKL
jgi:ectoine hydroxylase-related dioxygenase (phytanoyl-CoA dioxygenase family)